MTDHPITPDAFQHDPPQAATTLRGVAVIEAALLTMPLLPGVYRMLDAKGDALYVGKARALKKRVYSYTQIARLPERLRRMVHETVAMEVVTTHTEAEALLLEANLIKRLKPRFNIVLRDDKSYPWLVLTEDHAFPQITKHRGARTRKGSYYGPFASAWAVNQTVTALQRLIWCSRQGRVRLANTVSWQERSRNTRCSAVTVWFTAQADAKGP
jgi:excinuclease ABC subunit C